MKKTFLFIAILFLSASTSMAQNVTAESITGEWLTAPKDAKILIYKEGNKYSGKINWGKTIGRKDDKNPDVSIRHRELLGAVILKNFVFNGKDKWEDGTIYDPDNGKTYSCIIKLQDDKTLEVRGYIGFSVFGRTEIWTR
ncbi:MAG TPA: DUF2147 domain-containing protein [Chitinophagaceae bacterium]|nr:DUF2147 domain-containing protein [Chitinophagaceae bacterium]